MKRIILLALIPVSLSQAGIVKVVTFPVRHPVKSLRTAGKVVFYPVLHPKKTARVIL